MQRRSFCLTEQDYWQLNNIKALQEHQNLSEALRFCISFTFESLCLNPESKPANEVAALVRKNNLLLRYIFVELVKMHDGNAKPLSPAAQEYLEKVKQEIKKQMEKKQ